MLKHGARVVPVGLGTPIKCAGIEGGAARPVQRARSTAAKSTPTAVSALVKVLQSSCSTIAKAWAHPVAIEVTYLPTSDREKRVRTVDRTLAGHREAAWGIAPRGAEDGAAC